MSELHLNDLELALARKGWRIVAAHPGDDFGISATWEIQRSTRQPTLFLDFHGLEPMGRYCYPLAQSYGCRLRAAERAGLYFRKINLQRERWKQELAEFVDALDAVAGAA